MLTITRDNLLTLLRTIRGTTFATIVAEVEPALKRPKSNPMKNRLTKRSTVNVTLNHIYGNSVNRQREREGATPDFQAMARKWGKRIHGTTLVVHKGKFYVECKVERAISTEYLLDGDPVGKAEIAEHLAERPTSSRQGVDKQVILRDYQVNNIVEIHLNKCQYQIV